MTLMHTQTSLVHLHFNKAYMAGIAEVARACHVLWSFAKRTVLDVRLSVRH